MVVPWLTSPSPLSPVKTAVVSASISALCALTSSSGYLVYCTNASQYELYMRLMAERRVPARQPKSRCSSGARRRTCSDFRTALAETLLRSECARMSSCAAKAGGRQSASSGRAITSIWTAAATTAAAAP